MQDSTAKTYLLALTREICMELGRMGEHYQTKDERYSREWSKLDYCKKLAVKINASEVLELCDFWGV